MRVDQQGGRGRQGERGEREQINKNNYVGTQQNITHSTSTTSFRQLLLALQIIQQAFTPTGQPRYFFKGARKKALMKDKVNFVYVFRN